MWRILPFGIFACGIGVLALGFVAILNYLFDFEIVEWAGTRASGFTLIGISLVLLGIIEYVRMKFIF